MVKCSTEKSSCIGKSRHPQPVHSLYWCYAARKAVLHAEESTHCLPSKPHENVQQTQCLAQAKSTWVHSATVPAKNGTDSMQTKSSTSVKTRDDVTCLFKFSACTLSALKGACLLLHCRGGVLSNGRLDLWSWTGCRQDAVAPCCAAFYFPGSLRCCNFVGC